MDMAGKVVWVTGASSGIGEALSRELARRGARLILSARREEKLRALAQECSGEEHLVLALDLADSATLEAAAKRALERFGAVEIMIHNGGVSQRALVRDTDPAVDRRLLEVNYLGAVTLTKALLPTMLERGGGHFVVISSLVGKFGTPLRSSYSASKHALHGFFDSLRAELWGQGIRVTLVCPGFIRTPLPVHALTGDGSPQGTMDRAQLRGMAPEVCARRILRAVEREKEEVLIGGREVWAVYLKRWLPRFFSRVIRRVDVT